MATVGTFFLPWARSGEAERSGFALARAVDVVGLADTTPLRALLVGFWLCPLLTASAWTAAALGRRRVAGSLVTVVGAVAVAAAVILLSAGGVDPAGGAWAGIVAGMAALAGGLRLATSKGSHGR